MDAKMPKAEFPWKRFSEEQPYDYRTDSKVEDAPDYCWFVYRHVTRPNGGPYLSHAPCAFVDGVFRGYESAMKTSTYPDDRIEVLYWCKADAVRDRIMQDFNVKMAEEAIQVFEITLGRTPLLAATIEEAIVGLAKALPAMKVGQPYPIVIKKIEMPKCDFDRVRAATPWAGWSQDEERAKEAAAGELLRLVQL